MRRVFVPVIAELYSGFVKKCLFSNMFVINMFVIRRGYQDLRILAHLRWVGHLAAPGYRVRCLQVDH